MKSTIPYYDDFLSPSLKQELLKEARPYPGVPGLMEVGTGGGLENKDSLQFVCELYEAVKDELKLVLERRIRDRKFIDERTQACVTFNRDLKRSIEEADYKTVLGLEDGDGRIVFGPKTAKYCSEDKNRKNVAPIPEYLQGNHVTIFGPPDDAKLSINAMNAWHRQLQGEPEVVRELLAMQDVLPKWGADDEDSKTPMRADLVSAGENLTGCLEGTIRVEAPRKYELEREKLSIPIKRFPGLALPSFFLFYNSDPLPLHLYDFGLHLFRNWHNKKALAFYVPKLENEEEARYVRVMLKTAEEMIKKLHPEYEVGTIRLMIVLENPRAIFRTHEIIDELHPYFTGASLGWHDYLASTARLFREDPNYRIPVKADPNITINYIKASHDLLAEVVGTRGGVKIGGMYGVLSISSDLSSPSYQVTIKGYFRDVISQLKRGLDGFWVAHPDFMRIGLALTQAWKLHLKGDSTKLNELVTSLLHEKYQQEMLDFITGPDIKGFDKTDPRYARSLIVADIKESTFIANNHPSEIRYNVFQSLQYLTDWLSGRGCVALPAMVGGVAVRVMDDLATAERSRWEVWHEIKHGRFSLEEFLKIVHEEYNFIRKDLSNEEKIVQVKWDERTSKWYPVAMKLMLKLMTDSAPVEFATQLLLPFTMDTIRKAQDPWERAQALDPQKFALSEQVQRFNYHFEMCGGLKYASSMSQGPALDFDHARSLIMAFTKQDIIEAASFHGDIGENKKTLDKLASSEQARVLTEDEKVIVELRELGHKYKGLFGMKFLVSAKGKSGSELLTLLKERMQNSETQEIDHAKEALWEITKKRMAAHPLNTLHAGIEKAREKFGINSAQVAIIGPKGIQSLSFGNATGSTWFEMASLSKTVASAFALEYFRKKGVPLNTSVNELFSTTKSDFRLANGDKVTLSHLMNHSALNMHYVNGIPANMPMPAIRDFLTGNAQWGYEPVKVVNEPGSRFQYSGGGFLVLEHLIEALEGKSIFELTRPFLDGLGMHEFSFQQETISGVKYAEGFNDKGELIEGTRKMFPAFAAGSMGTARDMARFLQHLEHAYYDLKGSEAISHDTALMMLQGFDRGCMQFMGVKMGLGVFVGEAGPNKFAIHQGANDGFRCIYLHCFHGPDRGKGLVIVCNADLNGVLFNAEVTQLLLKELEMQGIDFSKFKSHFSMDSVPQEEIVNLGYKGLIFDAFIPTRPEPIVDKGPRDPLAPYNYCVGGKVLNVTNELFAQADNLLSDHLPKFDPELFGKQGKVMDSWETVRHNQAGVDRMTFELKTPASIRYVLLSTKYHFGNHAPVVSLEGLLNGQWMELLPKTGIEGHAEKRIKLDKETGIVTQIRVSMYPDGGFSRLGLYGEDLPAEEKKRFLPLKDAKSESYSEKIPHSKKPLSISFEANPEEVKKNLSKLTKGEEFNNASQAYGARLIRASNEHYGPAIQVISPFAPINMFDGLESARSRIPGHHEEVIVALAQAARIHRIELDFTYFVNNNPFEVILEGKTQGKWVPLVGRTNVKAFAGNQRAFDIDSSAVFEEIKVQTIPDGGMNRLRVYSFKV